MLATFALVAAYHIARHLACRHRSPPCALSAASDNWFVAAREGSVEILEQCLAEGMDVNSKSAAASGSTALHLSASFGHADAVKTLIDADADLDAVAKSGGTTALHSAAFGNRFAIVDLLIDGGADVNAEQADGSTALLEAAAAGHVSVVERLIEAKANPDLGATALPLPTAALKNHTDILTLLLNGGADPNAEEADGSTALLKAAYSGNVVAINLLLAAGADPQPSRDGLTALHYAAIEGHHAAVKALIAGGADVKAEDEGGNTPLRYVLVASEPAKIAHSLLQAGAEFEV